MVYPSLWHSLSSMVYRVQRVFLRLIELCHRTTLEGGSKNEAALLVAHTSGKLRLISMNSDLNNEQISEQFNDV